MPKGRGRIWSDDYDIYGYGYGYGNYRWSSYKRIELTKEEKELITDLVGRIKAKYNAAKMLLSNKIPELSKDIEFIEGENPIPRNEYEGLLSYLLRAGEITFSFQGLVLKVARKDVKIN